MIAIISGCGANIASIQFALDRLGKTSILTTDISIIQSASHVILPGVGTANNALLQLKQHQLIDVICALQQPVLGICLGMQILYEFSSEGNVNGLGILSGKITELVPQKELIIPHMGWNQLNLGKPLSPLLQGISNGSYVYYAHSFAAPVSKYSLAISHYGLPFSAAVQNNNFYGVQFHPERSGSIGEVILKNFLKII